MLNNFNKQNIPAQKFLVEEPKNKIIEKKAEAPGQKLLQVEIPKAYKPAPTSCEQIDDIKSCTESNFGCEWVSIPQEYAGRCQKTLPPPPPPKPKFACSQFVAEADCNNNSLGCLWDAAYNLCRESAFITAQSCFQAATQQACQALLTDCRWQNFLGASKEPMRAEATFLNNPHLHHQWHLLNKDWGYAKGINALDAWSITRGIPKL